MLLKALAAAAALAVVALSLGDASAAPKPKPAQQSCEAAAALKLVGQSAPDDAKVKKLTGAKTIRRVAPGQAVTMEYRPDRVTLEIAKDKIVSTACG